MITYITVDEQTKIRSELEDIQRTLRIVFSRLRSLDRSDDRVLRTEAALAAMERVLWTMTSGPGRLGPAVPIQAIVNVPASLYPVQKEAQRA